MRRSICWQRHGQIEAVVTDEIGDIWNARPSWTVYELGNKSAEITEDREDSTLVFPNTHSCFSVEAVTLRRPKSDRRQRRRLALKLIRESRFVDVAEKVPDAIRRVVLHADFDGLVLRCLKIRIETQLGNRARRTESLTVVPEEIQTFNGGDADTGAWTNET